MKRKRLRPKAGATPKLTGKLVEQFCHLIKDGLPADGVCDYLGISYVAFWSWVKKGEKFLNGDQEPKEHESYGYFVQSYRRALADFRLKLTKRLQTTNSSMWVRDMALLERRDRKSFSRNDQPGGPDESFDADDHFL